MDSKNIFKFPFWTESGIRHVACIKYNAILPKLKYKINFQFSKLLIVQFVKSEKKNVVEQCYLVYFLHL